MAAARLSAKRPLLQLDSEELLKEGTSAHRRRDVARLRECLRELKHRSSARAASVEEELRALLKDDPIGRSARRAEPSAWDKEAPTQLLFDHQIRECRLALIDQAARSVWLSSLTFPHADLVGLLAKKARSSVAVTLVVATRTVHNRDEDIRRLERADVASYFLASTHSKILVVDDEYVMIGSANAHGGHRDACALFRNRKLAHQSLAYLCELCDED